MHIKYPSNPTYMVIDSRTEVGRGLINSVPLQLIFISTQHLLEHCVETEPCINQKLNHVSIEMWVTAANILRGEVRLIHGKNKHY